MSAPFLLLTAPEGSFYAHVLRCLAEGFESLGIGCLTWNPHPEAPALAQWARKYRPAAVFEINRVLAPELAWPREVPHLAWLQDHRFNGEDLTRNLGASNHLYFIVHPDSFGVTMPSGRAWSVLVPGARSGAAAPSGQEMLRDYSMTGYIPAPLDDNATVGFWADGTHVQLIEFLREFPTEILSDAAFSMRDIHSAVHARHRQLGFPELAKSTLQSFDEILVRTLERRQILEDLLGSGGTLEIFGPPTWETWPQFAPHYRGNIADPRQLDLIYQTTRINVHNSGLTMHFRVMDCLAAGGFMLVNETPWDFKTGGIRQYLEPSQHYGAYPIKEVAAVAAHYLADEPARRRISAEGRRIVLAEHTWRDRARQILRDIAIAPPYEKSGTAALDQAMRALIQIDKRSAKAKARKVRGSKWALANPVARLRRRFAKLLKH